MRWIYPLQSHHRPTEIIHGHINWLKKIGFEVAYVRGDNEFFKDPKEWQLKGIQPESTVPYSPWQNGVSERGIWIILERTRAILYASHLP